MNFLLRHISEGSFTHETFSLIFMNTRGSVVTRTVPSLFGHHHSSFELVAEPSDVDLHTLFIKNIIFLQRVSTRFIYQSGAFDKDSLKIGLLHQTVCKRGLRFLHSFISSFEQYVLPQLRGSLSCK